MCGGVIGGILLLILGLGCGRSWSTEGDYTDVTDQKEFRDLVGLSLAEAEKTLRSAGWETIRYDEDQPFGARIGHPGGRMVNPEHVPLTAYRKMWGGRQEDILVEFSPTGSVIRIYNRFEERKRWF